MALVPEIGPESIITLGLAVVGVIGTYATLRAKVRELAERLVKTEARADATERSLQAFQLEASRTYVGRDALREVKEDLAREIKEIEHVVRGVLQTALGGIAPSRRRTGGVE